MFVKPAALQIDWHFLLYNHGCVRENLLLMYVDVTYIN